MRRSSRNAQGSFMNDGRQNASELLPTQEIMFMNNASSSALVLAFVAGALVLVPGVAGAELPPAGGVSPTPTVMAPGNTLMVQASIALGCSGSGASDVASRKHSITNTA